MSYAQTFPRPHTFLAVIHVQDFDQAERNINIAMENGADGVFLIEYGGGGALKRASHLIATYQAMKQRLPDDIWIGLNFLGLGLEMALGNLPYGCPGLWTDKGGIYEAEERDIYKKPSTIEAELFQEDRKPLDPDLLLWFGGVAFKHQPPVHDLPLVAKLATKYMDVVTTSGDRTGKPPSTEKLQIIREAIGKHTLANASGTTPENVHPMKRFVDCFLVASSILVPGSEESDPARVRAMADAIHA